VDSEPCQREGNSSTRLWNTLTNTNRRCFYWYCGQWTVNSVRGRGLVPPASGIHRRKQIVGVSIGVVDSDWQIVSVFPVYPSYKYLNWKMHAQHNNISWHNNYKINTSLFSISKGRGVCVINLLALLGENKDIVDVAESSFWVNFRPNHDGNLLWFLCQWCHTNNIWIKILYDAYYDIAIQLPLLISHNTC